MSRMTLIQTNFTAGELSPKVLGRVDIQKYANGAKIIENALPLIYGGVRNHYGSLYTAATKTASKKARLIPFVASITQAYVLEIGEGYMRVYTNNAQVLSAPLTPYEIALPYTEAQLPNIDFVQGADTMFLFHPDVPVYRIRRFADASWDAGAAPFIAKPFDELGDYPATSLTLSAATVGAARTATASGATFLPADVGRSITYLGGTFLITAYTDALHVTGDITTPFGAVAVPVNVWNLTGSPQTTLTPSAATPLEASITLTALANAFRTTDVGKWVRINGGLVLITLFTDALHVNGLIKAELSGTSGSPAGAWSLNGDVWSATNGYPRCGTIYQQRLCVGGTTRFPQTVWGSGIGAYLDFTLGLLDEDAFEFTIASDQSNPILHLVSGKVLTALTSAGEFTIKGGIEKPVTPTNVQIDSEAVYGASTVRPIRVGKEVLYVQRAGLKLLSMKYYAEDDSYDATNLTSISEHITGAGLLDMCYAQEPDPIVWSVRTDGQIATMTYSPENSVTAWVRRTTDGLYESVCSIPTASNDQTWSIVNRTIGGVTARYVERFDSTITLDAAITGTSGPGANVWAGLGHLEGKTVVCIADGSDMGDFLVVGGQITLPRNAFSVVIGLKSAATIEMLTPEVASNIGTAQGNAMSTHEIVVQVLNTQTLSANGVVIPFREFGSSLLDRPPPTYTGFKKLTNLGWGDGESPVTFTQDRPFPFHMLSVIRQFTVNSG